MVCTTDHGESYVDEERATGGTAGKYLVRVDYRLRLIFWYDVPVFIVAPNEDIIITSNSSSIFGAATQLRGPSHGNKTQAAIG